MVASSQSLDLTPARHLHVAHTLPLARTAGNSLLHRCRVTGATSSCPPAPRWT